jgi:hypothetical protein
VGAFMLSIPRAVLTLPLVGLFGGCGADLLPWPGFNQIGAAYVDTIPVSSVATEVQCEIYEFLDQEKKFNQQYQTKVLLDPAKGATVSLTLQTDLSGSVQYVGIDLSKLGFSSLGNLVAASNKVPSLQAKGSVKDTLSAEVDFVVAQSETPQADVGSKPPAPALIKKVDMGSLYQNATFVKVSDGQNLFRATPASTKVPPRYFPTAPCPTQNKIAHAYLQLWLQDWLLRFKSSQRYYPVFVCNSKVTLHSSFQLGVDVSAGVNPFLAPPLILPISGLNIDANPDYVHTLQISFALKDSNPDHARYCSGLEGAQPAQINPTAH